MDTERKSYFEFWIFTRTKSRQHWPNTSKSLTNGNKILINLLQAHFSPESHAPAWVLYAHAHTCTHSHTHTDNMGRHEEEFWVLWSMLSLAPLVKRNRSTEAVITSSNENWTVRTHRNKRRATQDARLVPATQRLKAALVLPEGDWTLKTSSRSAGKQHSQQTTHSHQKDVAAQEINVLTNISPWMWRNNEYELEETRKKKD